MADHKAEETNTTGSTLLGERVKSVAAIIAALYFGSYNVMVDSTGMHINGKNGAQNF